MGNKSLADLTWAEFEAYLLNDRKMSDKPSSIYALKSRFKTLSIYFMDKEFNRANFNAFIGVMRDKKYSVSYTNNFTKMAKHIAKYLNVQDMEGYTYFRENKSFDGDILSIEEIEGIINVTIPYKRHQTALNERNRLLFMLLCQTGCRVGESVGLLFSDVRSEPPFVIFRDTKNGDDRSVPISKELYEGIMNLPRRSEYVFSSIRNGKPLLSQEINEDLKARALACGIKKRVWCHLLRHSYVTICLDSGIDSMDVAALVGHKDTKTTLRYRHSSILHFSEVALMHPLRKKEMTFEATKKSLRDKVSRLVDTKFPVIIEENGQEFILRISSV